jgi:hypothetical protein
VVFRDGVFFSCAGYLTPWELYRTTLSFVDDVTGSRVRSSLNENSSRGNTSKVHPADQPPTAGPIH